MRRGMSLAEVLIVMIVVLFLFGLVITPFLKGGRYVLAHQTESGNGMAIIYRLILSEITSDRLWPIPAIQQVNKDLALPGNTSHQKSLAITAALFQQLHLQNKVDILPKLFVDSFSPREALPQEAIPDTSKMTNLQSLLKHNNLAYAYSYAADWSTPRDPHESRVVMAIRDPRTWADAGNEVTAVVYADSSWRRIEPEENIDVTNGSPTGITHDSYDVPLDEAPFVNRLEIMLSEDETSEKIVDMIYNNAGDGNNGFVIGRGSSFRSYVK